MHDYFTNNYVPPLTKFFIFVKAKVVAISLAYSSLTRVTGDSFTFYLCIFSKSTNVITIGVTGNSLVFVCFSFDNKNCIKGTRSRNRTSSVR